MRVFQSINLLDTADLIEWSEAALQSNISTAKSAVASTSTATASALELKPISIHFWLQYYISFMPPKNGHNNVKINCK